MQRLQENSDSFAEELAFDLRPDGRRELLPLEMELPPLEEGLVTPQQAVNKGIDTKEGGGSSCCLTFWPFDTLMKKEMKTVGQERTSICSAKWVTAGMFGIYKRF